MSPRLIIAAQSGAVIGLVGLSLYLGRRLADTQQALLDAARAPVALDTNATQRPLRLRLQQLPPINLPTRVEQLDWRSLESSDYAVYVANLRKTGCPEETIRDIIIADVNKLFATRRRGLAHNTNDWEYWLSADDERQGSRYNEALLKEQAESETLERERRQMLLSLLGPDALKSELHEMAADAAEERALQFLPGEKRSSVAEALARYRLALRDADGIADPGERATAFQEAEKLYSTALDQALTPEERQQYGLRSSPLADDLRNRLRGFGGSREEFEKLYQLEDGYSRRREELEHARYNGDDPQAAEKLEAATVEHEAKLKETLGEKRYADYLRVQDPDYQTLYGLARDHSVPPEVATQVWDMRATVEQQTDRIRADPLLTAEQKVRALEAIRGETKSAIVEVLGEPLLNEYSRQGGAWLSEMTDTQRLGETSAVDLGPVPALQPPAVDLSPPMRPPRFRRPR